MRKKLWTPDKGIKAQRCWTAYTKWRQDQNPFLYDFKTQTLTTKGSLSLVPYSPSHLGGTICPGRLRKVPLHAYYLGILWFLTFVLLLLRVPKCFTLNNKIMWLSDISRLYLIVLNIIWRLSSLFPIANIKSDKFWIFHCIHTVEDF